MAEFEIQLGRTATWASELERLNGELRRQKGCVESVARKLMFKGDYVGVEIALNRIASNIGKQQTQMKQYGGMLGNIVKAYKGAESAIVAKVTPAMKIESAVKETGDLVLSLISEFGLAGSVASTISEFLIGAADGIDKKEILSIIKDADGWIGKIADMAGKEAGERNWADFLFGTMSKSMWEKIDVKPSDSLWTKWKAALKDQIGLEDYIPEVGKNGKVATASKVQVATKYIGAALSFAMTAWDNKKEQGGVMNGRAWEETIVETGVSAVEGALIGSAVAAVIGSAPVVVVGAATVGVTWLVDMGYKAVTGSENGMIEDASDWICDHVVEPVGQAVTNWAKSTWNSVTDFFSGGKRKPAYSGAW